MNPVGQCKNSNLPAENCSQTNECDQRIDKVAQQSFEKSTERLEPYVGGAGVVGLLLGCSAFAIGPLAGITAMAVGGIAGGGIGLAYYSKKNP